MYVVLCILLCIGTVLLYQLVAKFLGYPGLQFKTAVDPNSLSHDAITTLLTKLGHPEFDGVCYGFTLNWALAVAEGNEDIFYQKIHLLRAHQTNLPLILERIEEKKQGDDFLSEEEVLVQTLPGLCKQVCIAQDPISYKEKYGKLVWQPDISTILKRIDQKNSGVRQVFYKTHTFGSRQEAVDYFNVLGHSGLSDNVAVVISTSDHAMGFKRAGNLWRFININDLYEQDKNKPYFEFDAQGLVRELYRVCTSTPLARRLTVNTDFIALKQPPGLMHILDNRYPVFPIGPRTTYKEKLSFFAMAALQGDMPTVKKCIRSGWSIFTRHQMSNDSPILTAIYLGRREVVKAMLSATPHRINHHRKKDLTTLLHLACRYGGSGIVEDLLHIKGIVIDPLDIKGKTPLMYACKSTTITDEKRLFELLLGRKASLTIKDKKGLTPLDHANKNNHQLAIQMISARMQTDTGTRQKSSSKKHQTNASSSLRLFKQQRDDGIRDGFEPDNENIVPGAASNS